MKRKCKKVFGVVMVLIMSLNLFSGVAVASDIDTLEDGGDGILIRRGSNFYLINSEDGSAKQAFTCGEPADDVLIGDWDGDGYDTICLRSGNQYGFINTLGGDTEYSFSFGKSTDEVLVGDWDGDGIDTLCLRRGSTFYISNSADSGTVDYTFTLGEDTDEIISGDWDGDGIDTLSIRNGNVFYIYNTLVGEADYSFSFGKQTDTVVVGDWDGDGTDGLCLRRGTACYISNDPQTGTIDTLFSCGRDSDEVYAGTWGEVQDIIPDTLGLRRDNTFYISYSLGGLAYLSFTSGNATDEILVGDWDGDGLDTVCLRRDNRYYFSNTPDGEIEFYIDFGKSTDEVLAGDWDGDGVDTLCIRRGNRYYINNTLEGGSAATDFCFGKTTDEVLAGDWDGDGCDTLCIRRGNVCYMNNTLEGGNASVEFAFGKSTDSVLAGDWDGDGLDTLCIRRGNTCYINNSLTGGNAETSFVFGKETDEVFAGKWQQQDEDIKTVAAVGEIAIMVSMLGCGDEVVAADEDTLSLAAANDVFSDLSGAEAVWSGDGSECLESGDLEELIELHPDAIVYTSGNGCISDDDAATLAEAGIKCKELPDLTSLDNIQSAMTSLGDILGDRTEDGGSNAPEKAAEYVSWVDDMLSYVSDAAGDDPMYTLYISDWDSDAVYTMTSIQTGTSVISGTGCAIVENYLCDTTVLMTSLLSCAGITNTASKPYYLSAAKLYTTSLRYSYGSWTVSGSKASNNGFNNSNSKYLEASYTIEAEDGSSDTVTTSLGLSTFPCVIVANSDVQEGILNSKSQTNGQWAVYEHINSADNTFNSDAFLDSVGNMVRTQISADYDVLVNPSGLCSWTDGTAESVLETVWAAYAIQGAIPESEVRSYISDFYTCFYGYTPSSAEITAILEGD